MKSINAQRADVLRRHTARVIRDIVEERKPNLSTTRDLKAILRERKIRG